MIVASIWAYQGPAISLYEVNPPQGFVIVEIHQDAGHVSRPPLPLREDRTEDCGRRIKSVYLKGRNRHLYEDSGGERAVASMEKETATGIRVSTEWALGVGAVIAIVAGMGVLIKPAVVLLVAVGVLGLSAAAFEHGWISFRT